MPSPRRLLREPLLHFAAIGALLFGAYAMIPGKRSSPAEIVVTRGKIDQLASGFTRIWQRPPTQSEWKGLIDDWVREEIAVREATAMGLDRDDTVIRRRLRQKLEFLSEDVAAETAPTDDDLKAFLTAHPEKFRVERRYSFRQIYLNPQRHEHDLQARLEAVHQALNRPGTDDAIEAMGDPSLLEPRFENLRRSEVESQFGPTFVAALERLSPGKWEGPIESGYGLHFLRLLDRAEGHVADLAEVREAVRREWANDRRLRSLEAFYDAALKRYTVHIEPLAPASEEARP